MIWFLVVKFHEVFLKGWNPLRIRWLEQVFQHILVWKKHLEISWSYCMSLEKKKHTMYSWFWNPNSYSMDFITFLLLYSMKSGLIHPHDTNHIPVIWPTTSPWLPLPEAVAAHRHPPASPQCGWGTRRPTRCWRTCNEEEHGKPQQKGNMFLGYIE